MRFSWLILLWFLFPVIAMAQNGTITGKVIAKGSGYPISRASVFLSNSSFGTATASDGTFALNGIRPGQYTVVVSLLGYAEYKKTILIANEQVKLNIELEPKPIELRAVTISSTSKADWRRNYEQFKREFIGTDDNARYCNVVNSQILDFSYSKSKQVLEATTDEFLIVENKALGYRVKFLLKDFKSDKIAGTISYEGERLFEELPGTPELKKKWQTKRDEAYYGSPMHFYRALYTNTLKEEGFEIRRLSRTLNPDRPPEAIIQKKITLFKSMRLTDTRLNDSANYWIDKENLPRYVHQHFVGTPWYAIEVLRTTEQPGLYVITFPDYLYVTYTKKFEKTLFEDMFVPLDMPNYEGSIITLFDNPPHALFDSNGIIIGDSPFYEGTWSKARLSALLPVDYIPSGK